MMTWVRAIEGRTAEGRKAFVRSRLDSLRVPYRLMPFDTSMSQRGQVRFFRGENTIVRLGSGARTTVVGAHIDAGADSPGANDNAGGVAVVLMLIAKLRTHAWKGTVDFVFFDQEESGLFGSAAYVARNLDRNRHLGMINLDVVGTGDVLYVGPVGGGDDDHLMQSLRKVARAHALSLVENERYPGSDYLPFARAGLENISVSVLPKSAVEWMNAMLKGSPAGSQTPEFAEVMHTPRDSSSRMSAGALRLAFTLVKGTLLDLDASAR